MSDVQDDDDWTLKEPRRSGEDAVRERVADAELMAEPANAVRAGELIRTAEGGVRACLANARMALNGGPLPDLQLADNPMEGVLAFNEFSSRAAKRKPPPWARAGEAFPSPWTPHDDLSAADWLQRHGCMVNPKIVSQAAELAARDHPFHPVRDYLLSLKWDGIDRLDFWLSDHLGCEDSDLVRAQGRRWMISAVARVFVPGCKADAVLVLEGPQGALKSSALRLLGDPWFTDDFAEIGTKDASLGTAGAWIIELAELDALARAQTSSIKAFLTRCTDRFRPPYGERLVEWPRQCVFAGSTNMTGGYLRDETGGRRFWPVRCGAIDLKTLKQARAQLWAEAVARFLREEPWWLDTDELQLAAAAAQAERYEGDAWDDAIANYSAARTEVSLPAILEMLGLPRERWDRSAQMRIARSLTALGWRRRQRRFDDGRRKYVYVSPTAEVGDGSVTGKAQ